MGLLDLTQTYTIKPIKQKKALAAQSKHEVLGATPPSQTNNNPWPRYPAEIGTLPLETVKCFSALNGIVWRSGSDSSDLRVLWKNGAGLIMKQLAFVSPPPG